MLCDDYLSGFHVDLNLEYAHLSPDNKFMINFYIYFF